MIVLSDEVDHKVSLLVRWGTEQSLPTDAYFVRLLGGYHALQRLGIPDRTTRGRMFDASGEVVRYDLSVGDV